MSPDIQKEILEIVASHTENKSRIARGDRHILHNLADECKDLSKRVLVTYNLQTYNL